MTIQCFWLEPNGKARRSLRRYRGLRDGEICSGALGFHDASFAIDEVDAKALLLTSLGDDSCDANTLADFAGDSRWPVACACGYRFTEADPRAVFLSLLFQRRDTGAVVTIEEAPDGAMYGARREIAPDGGTNLMVKTPGGTWAVDNGGWTRTGDPRALPPTVTATPSILISGSKPEYHGWLRNGQLVDA